MDTNDPKIRTKAAAKFVDAAPQTMAKWRSRGRGPAYIRVGGKVFYRVSDLQAFIERGRVDPAEQAAKPKSRRRA